MALNYAQTLALATKRVGHLEDYFKPAVAQVLRGERRDEALLNALLIATSGDAVPAASGCQSSYHSGDTTHDAARHAQHDTEDTAHFG